MRSHQWIDQRSLALHQAVAAKLEAHPQLLDILRAAAAIADERHFGSQSVLGQFPQAPDALLVSIEADIYARAAPAKSD